MASHEDDNAHKHIISPARKIDDLGKVPFLEDVVPLWDIHTASPSFDEAEDVDIKTHKIKKAQEGAPENT